MALVQDVPAATQPLPFMALSVRLDVTLPKHHCSCNTCRGPLQQSYPKQVVYLEGLLEGSASCGEIVGRAVDSPHVFQGSTEVWVASSIVQCNHICRVLSQLVQNRVRSRARRRSAQEPSKAGRHNSTYDLCSILN